MQHECPKCHKSIDAAEYGSQYACRACHAEYTKTYRQKIRAKRRVWKDEWEKQRYFRQLATNDERKKIEAERYEAEKENRRLADVYALYPHLKPKGDLP